MIYEESFLESISGRKACALSFVSTAQLMKQWLVTFKNAR